VTLPRHQAFRQVGNLPHEVGPGRGDRRSDRRGDPGRDENSDDDDPSAQPAPPDPQPGYGDRRQVSLILGGTVS